MGARLLPVRFDLRSTTWAPLETTMQMQMLSYFGMVSLNNHQRDRVRVGVNSSEFGTVRSYHPQGRFACGNGYVLQLPTSGSQINPASAVAPSD